MAANSLRMVDLRFVDTGVKLTQRERMTAEMQHLAAMNDAQLAEKKARNARRGLKAMDIGTACVSKAVARVLMHCKVA